MARIPTSKRQKIGPGGSDFPGGSMDAIRLAGDPFENLQRAGNALTQTGAILGQFAAKQKEAQDVIDRQTANADASVALEEIYIKNKSQISDPSLFQSTVETESKELPGLSKMLMPKILGQVTRCSKMGGQAKHCKEMRL